MEEIEDEEILDLISEPRLCTHNVFTKRSEEGYFKILIQNHLNVDDRLFGEFFRLTKKQFQFVCDLLEEDISKHPCNRTPHPITREEKLAITLR